VAVITHIEKMIVNIASIKRGMSVKFTMALLMIRVIGGMKYVKERVIPGMMLAV